MGVFREFAVLALGLTDEDADFLGANDRALLGVDLAGEDLHEGRFAGTVRSGEPIAAASGKRDGDILEEELGAVTQGDSADWVFMFLPIL